MQTLRVSRARSRSPRGSNGCSQVPKHWVQPGPGVPSSHQAAGSSIYPDPNAALPWSLLLQNIDSGRSPGQPFSQEIPSQGTHQEGRSFLGPNRPGISSPRGHGGGSQGPMHGVQPSPGPSSSQPPYLPNFFKNSMYLYESNEETYVRA